MVRVSDIICSGQLSESTECELVVSADASAQEVLLMMQQNNCDHIAVAGESGKQVLLSREDVLRGLLSELDQAQDKLRDLYISIDESFQSRLDSISDKVAVEAELQKNKLKLAVDNMNEGLIILDQHGAIEESNPAAKKLLGLDENGTFEELAEALDAFGFCRVIENSDGSAKQNRGDLVVKNQAGRIVQLQWTEIADRDDYFIGHGRVVTIRDITEEVTAQRLKTEFVSTISHELRTPITSMQNSVSNMIAGVTGKLSNKMKSYLDTMKNDCERYTGVINDLLDTAAIETGDISIFRKVTNIESITKDAMSRFAHEAAKKNIRLFSEVDADLPLIYVDPQRIFQVIANLISNAIRFTHDGGEVTLRSYQTAEDIIVTVQDNGVGISPDEQEDIFSKFRQINREAGAGSQGTGLGLAICKGIVEFHGGEIWVESAAGKGSSLSFSISKVDVSFILRKHLESLKDRYAESGRKIGLLVTKFEIKDGETEKNATIIAPLIEELTAASKHFMGTKEHFAIKTDEFELSFAFVDAERTQMVGVQEKIREIIKNRLRNKCTDTPIVPMSGVAVYPDDSCDIREMEKIARGNIEN